MKTCATCRFMGAPMGIEFWDGDGGDPVATNHHACARIIHGNDSGHGLDRLNGEPAVVTDGSGYTARLKVLPTFGCVLHEETKGT